MIYPESLWRAVASHPWLVLGVSIVAFAGLAILAVLISRHDR